MKIQFAKLTSILLFLNICYASQGQVNLLKNGNFEMTEAGKISDWILLSKRSTFVSSSKGQFLHGKLSAFLKSKSNNPATKMPVSISSGHIVDIKPGKEYSLSFYAKSANKLEYPLRTFFYTSPIKDAKHWYKIKKIDLSTDWTKYTFKVRLPDAKKWSSRKLEIRFSIPFGSVYIDEVSLVCEDKIKVVSFMKRRNILENPGFDDGISGWLTCQYYSKTVLDKRMMKIDKSVKHDGIASLKIPAYGVGLYSRRYEFKPNQKYTLSFFAKTGDDKGRGINVFIRDMQYKKVSALKLNSSKLSKNWKRYSLSFKSPSLGEPYANSFLIRVDPLSTVWIDSFQLEEGNMTNYSPGPQVGIAFNDDGVFERGKNELINISVSIPKEKIIQGSLELLVKCNDIRGNTVFSEIQKISMDRPTKLIPVTVKFKRLGVIRVTASLLMAKNQLAFAEWNALVKDKVTIAPNPLFGTDVRAGSLPYSYAKANEKLEKIMGTGINRTFFTHYAVRETPNLRQDNPALLKMVKANYALEKAAGRRVIIAVNPDIFSPLNLRNMWKTKRSSLPPDVLNKEIEIFAKQAFNIASALSKEVAIFEIMNEPNIWRFNGKRIIPPEIYVRILRDISKAVRSAAPKMQIAANINCLDFNYAKKIFELGAAKYIDVFTIHPYRANAEKPSVYDDIKKLRTIIDKYNPKIEIINDEQYYGSRSDIASNSEYDRHYCAQTNDDCAARIAQTALHGIAADKVPFVLHANHFYEGISNSPYYCFPFGILRTLSRVIRDVNFTEQIKISNKLRIFIFVLKSGEKVVSINTRDYNTQIKFGINPIFNSILDVEGNVLPKTNTTITYLPVYYIFGAKTSVAAIKKMFKNAKFSSKGFPIAVSLKRASDNKLVMKLINTTPKDVAGILHIKETPSAWVIPSTIKFKLKSFGSKEIHFEPKQGKFSWRGQYLLSFTGEASGIITKRIVKAPAFMIPETKNKPSVDGDLSDWKDAKWLKLGRKSLSRNFNPNLSYKGSKDISAKIAFSWNPDGLYLAVKVKDNKFVTGSVLNSLHAYDSVQIYFDPQNDAKKGAGYGAGDISYTLGVDKNGNTLAWLTHSPGTRFIGASNAITGKDGDVKTAFKKVKGGYIYEAFFPNSTIPGIKLKSDSVFGLSILINDNDGKGRKQGLTLGPKYTEPYQKPYLWPCMQLK